MHVRGCLTSTPEIGWFEEVAHGHNPEDWDETAEQLCFGLKDILGEEDAAKLRFRIGTEMNGRERFHGTEYR
ncbi:MAG: hypothetical protein GY790_19165, partial [Bacteroidetes bacterium]|nr:hypothetical protein [Bacteroidota bacterium]